MQAGIAVKPKTGVDVLWDILDNPEKSEVPDVRVFCSLPLPTIAGFLFQFALADLPLLRWSSS